MRETEYREGRTEEAEGFGIWPTFPTAEKAGMPGQTWNVGGVVLSAREGSE